MKSLRTSLQWCTSGLCGLGVLLMVVGIGMGQISANRTLIGIICAIISTAILVFGLWQLLEIRNIPDSLSPERKRQLEKRRWVLASVVFICALSAWGFVWTASSSSEEYDHTLLVTFKLGVGMTLAGATLWIVREKFTNSNK